jgi:hypothetical protein
MRLSLRDLSRLYALGVVLVLASPAASFEPNQEVATVASAWARALGEDDPDKVLPLYAEDAL